MTTTTTTTTTLRMIGRMRARAPFWKNVVAAICSRMKKAAARYWSHEGRLRGNQQLTKEARQTTRFFVQILELEIFIFKRKNPSTDFFPHTQKKMSAAGHGRGRNCRKLLRVSSCLSRRKNGIVDWPVSVCVCGHWLDTAVGHCSCRFISRAARGCTSVRFDSISTRTPTSYKRLQMRQTNTHLDLSC